MNEESYAKLVQQFAFDGKVTHGAEFCETKEEELNLLEVNTLIGYCDCQMCGRGIIAVKDQLSAHGWCYFGLQVSKPNVYSYSPSIQTLRKYYGVQNQVWKNNPLMNSFSRVHMIPGSWNHPLKVDKRCHMILCNECFAKTKHRELIEVENGLKYSISVVDEWGETLESLCNQLNIVGKYLGPGALKEY